MTREEMKAKIAELRELKNMKTELEDMITSIEDEIKAEMTAQDIDTMVIDEFKVTWKPVFGSRFDSTAFKKDHPDLAQKYTKSSVSRRFIA